MGAQEDFPAFPMNWNTDTPYPSTKISTTRAIKTVCHLSLYVLLARKWKISHLISAWRCHNTTVIQRQSHSMVIMGWMFIAEIDLETNRINVYDIPCRLETSHTSWTLARYALSRCFMEDSYDTTSAAFMAAATFTTAGGMTRHLNSQRIGKKVVLHGCAFSVKLKKRV